MKTILWVILLLTIVVLSSSSRLTLRTNGNDEDRQSTPPAELRHLSSNRSREFSHHRQHHNQQQPNHHHRLMHKQHEHTKRNATTLLVTALAPASGKASALDNNMTTMARNIANNKHIVMARTNLTNNGMQAMNHLKESLSIANSHNNNDNRTIKFDEPPSYSHSQLQQPKHQQHQHHHQQQQVQPLKLRRLSYDQQPELEEDTAYQKQTYQITARRPFYRRTVRNFPRTTRYGRGNSDDWSRQHNNNDDEAGNAGHSVIAWNSNKDEILRDVEHIGAANTNDWLPQIPTDSMTTTIKPTTTTTTYSDLGDTDADDSYNTNRINGRRTGTDNSRDNTLETDSSRHICMQHKTSQVPVKTTEVFSRPIWKRVAQPCQMNRICTRVQLVHEPAYRDVIRHKTTKQIHYDCCPGWGRLGKNANACMKPICSERCRNGGTCIKPDECSCPSGFMGKFCEQDINECETEKPCDQLCLNTEGSYYCKCREGFQLQSDRQSCRKHGTDQDDAFEARDLENEIDTNEVTLRLHKIEKTLAGDRLSAHEFQKTLQETSHVVESLQSRLTTMEKQQQNINHLQMSLMTNEAKTQKLENLVNILFKCRTNPGPYCT